MLQTNNKPNECDDRTSAIPSCRFCRSELRHTFVDLGMSPLCQTHIEPHQLNHMEPFYPLHAYVCEKCFLVQLDQYVASEAIFSEYAYFSSYSDSWVQHAKTYAEKMVTRFGINPRSLVTEIASNDGYLLQHFVAMKIPVLGIEPAAQVHAIGEARGARIVATYDYTDESGALLYQVVRAALVYVAGAFGNYLNVDNAVLIGLLPDLPPERIQFVGNTSVAGAKLVNSTLSFDDFVAGMKILLKSDGIITMEFPHLMRLMQESQFDTIYHEHFSYFSFTTVEKVFAAHGLTLFDVEELPTHGGSLRIYARHSADTGKPVTERVTELRSREAAAGFTRLETYFEFSEKVKETKRAILDFLIRARREGKTIAGYGAPGKGNTLLNYCGIRTDFLDYTVDRNPYKQGKYTPGTRIPIYPPEKIKETKPDYLFILPWNLKDEIMSQTGYIRDWGGRFVVPIPDVRVY